jgi:GH25 family lysozyme M1 (1,4-beta-N-acetylmuramidase)
MKGKRMNTTSAYPKGVDGSHYQSEIDWATLKQNVDFVLARTWSWIWD